MVTSSPAPARKPLTGISRAIAEHAVECEERELRSKLGDVELAEYHQRIGFTPEVMESYIATQLAELRERYGLD